jgi:hypothetical protein
MFRFCRAAFYQGLKSKFGLAATKAAALRINLNIEGWRSRTPNARSLSLCLSSPPHSVHSVMMMLSFICSFRNKNEHNLPFPRVH